MGIYLARYLGPSQFGTYSYAIAFVGLFGGFAKLGLDGIVVRDLVRHPDRRDIYLGTAFWLKVAGALVTIGAIIVSTLYANNPRSTNLYVAIISAGLLFQAFEVIDFHFQSQVQAKFVSICKIIQLTISSALKVVFVLASADLVWLVAVTLFDQITLAVSLAFTYRRQSGHLRWSFQKSTAREMLLSARPYIVSGLMVSIYSNADRVIIQQRLSAREVGLYSAAVGISMALNFLPTLLTNSLFPAIVNAKTESESLYRARLSLLYKTLTLTALVVCTVIALLSNKIMSGLYGVSFEAAGGVLAVYVWNFVFACFSSLFGKWILVENLQFLVPRFTALAMAVNIVACLVLIPIFAIRGAAMAAVCAQAIPLAWYAVTNKHVRGQLSLALFVHRRTLA